jgi:hypothetical protein
MEPWMWAVVLKPFATVLFFAAIIIPIELTLRKFIPAGRLKAVLFDRTFRDRRPWLFMLWWVVLVGGMWGAIFFIYG